MRFLYYDWDKDYIATGNIIHSISSPDTYVIQILQYPTINGFNPRYMFHTRRFGYALDLKRLNDRNLETALSKKPASTDHTLVFLYQNFDRLGALPLDLVNLKLDKYWLTPVAEDFRTGRVLALEKTGPDSPLRQHRLGNIVRRIEKNGR